jgi:hypothetical protein
MVWFPSVADPNLLLYLHLVTASSSNRTGIMQTGHIF